MKTDILEWSILIPRIMNNQGVISNPKNTYFPQILKMTYPQSIARLIFENPAESLRFHNGGVCLQYSFLLRDSEWDREKKEIQMLVYYRNLFGIWFASGDFALHTLFVIAWS